MIYTVSANFFFLSPSLSLSLLLSSIPFASLPELKGEERKKNKKLRKSLCDGNKRRLASSGRWRDQGGWGGGRGGKREE